MGKMMVFDGELDRVKTAEDLAALYRQYQCGDLTLVGGTEKPATPQAAFEELTYCSGAAFLVTARFMGNRDFALKAEQTVGSLGSLLNAAGLNDFSTKFVGSTSGLAYMESASGVAHCFVIVKGGTKYALYQANSVSSPRYTLARALNDHGYDFCFRGMDEAAFKSLLTVITTSGLTGAVFRSELSAKSYKYLFTEYKDA